MDVYLSESVYEGTIYYEFILRVKGTDICLAPEGYDNYSELEVVRYTTKFWQDVRDGKCNFVKICSL